MSVRYTLGCDLSYDVRSPTTFIFNIEVARLGRHGDLEEQLTITPPLPVRRFVSPDLQNRYLSIDAEPGPLHLHYAGQVTLAADRAEASGIREMDLPEIPLSIMPFLLPSRFVPSDRLAGFALKEFADIPRGHARVTEICNWIYTHIDYQRGSSDGTTTASESLIRRAGVCRDFAHLGIAFCRALNIPARFVSCYAHGLEPADFHAVFEAYLDGRWWLFDATRQADLDGLVRIGAGRDAAEIAFCTPFGALVPGPVEVRIARMDKDVSSSPRTIDAISTADPVNAGET